ncbi:hypothetical protein ASPZODRAFT_138766 [Penicilliopsis zonata CBS 506.65]|uniref:OPT family small oligopeptide transporter n=1 Tax=Penicilliopsis zonata CBS 506.65 TaxID=1073090 RepID=A0A1L9SXA0_9EURO|nr:hypothetical protein ASPZODRAFT_138766 [Penicilliopsis zonata CBS 506.65]OJJ51693.1 hypothetical protein ASPZODRAFT_138766 [Penicilliopsis zonata CBS 506.65]
MSDGGLESGMAKHPDSEKPRLNDEKEEEEQENSPYPEVRASVPTGDEVDLPVNTFRAWVLGIVGTMILTALNQFFQLHSPPIFLSSYLAILITLPCGKLMAATLPTTTWNIMGWRFTLNPGPFNQKEHSIVAIMASLVTAFDNGSLASDVYVAFDKFLNIPVSVGYRFVFLLTTQALSFGIAGFFHRFLVEPAFCVWPAALPVCSLLHSFHDNFYQGQIANGWKISRMRFFWVVCGFGAAYQFLPGYLFTGLSTFAWVTWIVPNNVAVNQVFGATSGMDLLPLTLDWNQITGYLGSPLLVPTWALVNVFCGSVFFLWVIAPALHWSNVWEGLYFPFSSSDTFDNTGQAYNTTRVMNSDYSLNETAYFDYSPVYLSTTSILSYGLGFASVISVIIHTALYHREVVWNGLRATFGNTSPGEKEDIHSNVLLSPRAPFPLMKNYKPVPLWWYGGIFLAIFGISVAFLYVYDTGLPWYGLILAIVLNVVLVIPTGIMMSTCNVTLSTTVISALIAGYIWPGQMVNNVVFKIFTIVSSYQGLGYIQDMKVGHYMKIPPRVTFAAQCAGILVSWLTQTAVNIWAMGNVKNICTAKAENDFECPLAAGYSTNAVFWGLIGPKRLFASGSMYRPMLWFFLIGALLPIVLFIIDKRYPRARLRKVHLPVIFASTASIPPATAANYIAWGVVGLFFNGYLKQRYRAWWMKYNYLLSAGLEAALAVGTFLIFFCLSYPAVELNWFGNTIASTTADGKGTPLRVVPEGKTFGPTTWN